MKQSTDNKQIIFLLVTVIFIIVATIAIYKPTSDTASGELFLPHLKDNVEKISTIVIQKKDEVITIKKLGEHWVLPEKGDYSVDWQIIRELVVTATEMKLLEKKTNDRSRLSKLGLDLTASSNAYSAQVIFMDATENEVYADFIRGFQRGFGNVAEQKSLYVRKSNDNQAWLVQGDLDFKLNLDSFVNRPEYKIDPNRIMSVSFYPSSGKAFSISRLPNKDFEITSPPKKAKSRSELNRLGAMLHDGIKFVDVFYQSQIPFINGREYQIKYETFDGLAINLNILLLEENGVWIKISATALTESKENEAEMINSVAKDWVMGYQMI